MLDKIIGIVVLLTTLSLGYAVADKYDPYVGNAVSINVNNTEVYQGILMINGPTALILNETCDLELGRVIINKSLIVDIWNGTDCEQGDYCPFNYDRSL